MLQGKAAHGIHERKIYRICIKEKEKMSRAAKSAFHHSIEYEDYLDSCPFSMVSINIKDIPENADIKNLEEMFR